MNKKIKEEILRKISNIDVNSTDSILKVSSVFLTLISNQNELTINSANLILKKNTEMVLSLFNQQNLSIQILTEATKLILESSTISLNVN